MDACAAVCGLTLVLAADFKMKACSLHLLALALSCVALRLDGAPPPGTRIRQTQCTSWPRPLNILGFANLCADMYMHPCQNTVSVEIYLEGATDDLFFQEISPDEGGFCAKPPATSAVTSACGTDSMICMSFIKDGQDTLHIGPRFLSGCPSVTLKNCRTFPGAYLPEIPMQLDCFQLGFNCSNLQTCDKCIEKGCGWCSEGGGQCMEGGLHGPMCSTCGSNCSCSWSYGQCKVPEADMEKFERDLNQTAEALKKATNELEDLEDVIRDGKAVDISGTSYKCKTDGQMKSSRAISTTFAVLICLFTFLGSTLVGCYSGKQGYADALLERLSSLKRRVMSRNTMDAGSLYS
ncbi:hypothetical protein GUITHDRAFT_111603 [Guillardia theta CCMP2712]|uniref:TNFR-Cys domain-containing protein n=2 Tax=Guillardia theta TaxID=55529 RepID=L1J1D1_GUITC|nr:hypothetical protein GUITHDRAFT_111603 [Guillardia theta CCMP2712]EKX42328.1 hypothetical protein GUITHDRAFT_111603 [Guillardia theta CCMP2712]|eukprot:XP_005829308.1 hypothetical protein GUITHDRAFT_111603 [Guillardia theta CCMP2712]